MILAAAIIDEGNMEKLKSIMVQAQKKEHNKINYAPIGRERFCVCELAPKPKGSPLAKKVCCSESSLSEETTCSLFPMLVKQRATRQMPSLFADI